MLARLMRVVSYRSGIHTQNLQRILQDFKPVSEDRCIETLKTIQKKKEYLAVSQVSESFIDRIEYFILKKQTNLSSKSLFIYKSVKELDMLTPSFKYGILSKLKRQIAHILQSDLRVKNNELEVLLWFVFREYPFLRQSQFQDIAEQHTLKLFDMHEFMTTNHPMPKWEPYLRITNMLHSLGHHPESRTDITTKQILLMNYKYLPFLTCLFPTEQACAEIKARENIHEPFLMFLCHQYIDLDQMKYDAYLQYTETIDNEQQGEEMERYFDSLSWTNFSELLQLYVTSFQLESFDDNLAYKIIELFWRICETKKIELQNGIRILQLISQNPNCLGSYESSLCSRILQTISDADHLEFSFIPQAAIIELFRSVQAMNRIEKTDKVAFFQGIVKKINRKTAWSQENKAQLEEIAQEIDTSLFKLISEYLKLEE